MKKLKAKVHFLTGLFVLMALLVCSPAVSWAVPVPPADYLDFNMDATHPAGASISYAGGAAPLIGVDISVDTVAGYQVGGVLVNGPVGITGGLLTFTTGNIVSSSPNVWNFSGGTLSLAGTIPGSGTPLLNGTFDSMTVLQLGSGPGATFNIALGSFMDTKDSFLANYFFGYTPPGFEGSMNLSFLTGGAVGTGAAFSSTSVLSGDVYNNPVPLPGAVWLLGTGLMGLVGVRRRLHN